MDYTRFSAEDFALDERFQKWVLDPDNETISFWEKWLRDNPQQQSVVENARELIYAAGLSKDPKLNQEYLSVWNNLQEHAASTRRPAQSAWTYMKVAAALLILVVSAFVLWKQFYLDVPMEYRTGFNETRQFVLEDGSKVTLNANSLLSFSKNWNEQTAREVFLEGEAFFEVVRTADKKEFKINTEDHVRIDVLGTEFNVNTRREQVAVYLQSGIVRINSRAGDTTLKPGEFLVYKIGDASLNVLQASAHAEEMIGWKENVFVFNDTPLAEVVKQLEDHYGFEISFQNQSLATKRITAKVPREDADVLLNVLSETLDIRIEKDGNKLNLKSR